MGIGDFFKGAGSALTGGLIGAGGGVASAAMMAREAKKNRKFQKKMYRHRYQYTVKDMRKAGINPILAAGSGLGGGGSPSGSMASQPDLSRIGEQVTTGKKVHSEVAIQKLQRALIDAQTNTAGELARKTAAEADITEAGIPFAKMNEEFYNSAPGRAAFFAEKFGHVAGALGGGILGGIIGGRAGRRKPGRSGSSGKKPFYTPAPKPRPKYSHPGYPKLTKKQKEKLRQRIKRDFIKD